MLGSGLGMIHSELLKHDETNEFESIRVRVRAVRNQLIVKYLG